MVFNWEISLGSLGAILTVAGGVASFYFGTRNDMKQLQAAMLGVKDDLKLLNKVVMEQALSNQRQDNFEESTRQEFMRLRDDIRDMKHGRGFIKAEA